MSADATVRDEVLGMALRDLDVPEHRPDFHARLHYLLGEEHRRRLADERRRVRVRRRRIAWGVRLAAAAVMLAAIAVASLPRTKTAPEAASWVQVRARVSGGLSSARTMSGEIALRSKDPLTGTSSSRWAFGLTAKGDFRLRQTDGKNDLAYDAAHGVERSLNGSASIQDASTLFASERKGLAPGRPDPGPSDSILGRDLGAVVRALLAADDPRVEEAVYEGRPAWHVEVPVPANLVYPDADRFDITVDQETGVPVHVIAYLHGRARSELRVEKLAVDSKLGAGEFTVPFPSGTHVEREDAGFRRYRLDQVRDEVGYPPLVPSVVPAGYGLEEVAVARRSLPTGVEGGNPESRNVVSLSYRRGLDQFIVTTRLRHVPGYSDEWSDPLATGEGFRDDPQKVTLQAGALSGLTGDLLIVPRNVPHLWVLTNQLVVTVSGDLTRAELVAVAQSLESAR